MRGTLYIVAAPSGAGKSSLVNAVLSRESGIVLSISFTSRKARPGERHAQHYHFIGKEEFESMIASGDFFEHALVHGDYKGTAKQSVEPQLAAGKDVLLEIPSSVKSHPLVVEFCLMWGFRVEKSNSNIKMISCDTISSLFSKVTSLLKAAICSVVCSFTEDAFQKHGPALVTSVRKSHVIHSLSPMVRQLREMHRRLPKRRKTTLDDTGNIAVDQFFFLFDDWSLIVPQTVNLMNAALSNLADGIWWEPVVDIATKVEIVVDRETGDLRGRANFYIKYIQVCIYLLDTSGVTFCASGVSFLCVGRNFQKFISIDF